MRVNVYSEEMTGKVELVTKTVEGEEFTAVRFWLYLPVTTGATVKDGETTLGEGVMQVQGPFMHRPGDDDSSAVTFWGKQELRKTLAEALRLLDEHYEPDKIPDAVLVKLQGEKLTADADLERTLQKEIAELKAKIANLHAAVNSLYIIKGVSDRDGTWVAIRDAEFDVLRRLVNPPDDPRSLL